MNHFINDAYQRGLRDGQAIANIEAQVKEVSEKLAAAELSEAQSKFYAEATAAQNLAAAQLAAEQAARAAAAEQAQRLVDAAKASESLTTEQAIIQAFTNI